MARKKKPGSKTSFGGLGLPPDEESKLADLLKSKDLSLRQLTRYLLRRWMNDQPKAA